MALKFTRVKPNSIEEVAKQGNSATAVLEQPAEQCTKAPEQIVFLADNGQLRIKVTLEDESSQANNVQSEITPLSRFRAAYYTWLILTEESGQLRQKQTELKKDRQELKVRIIKGQNYCALHKDSQEGKALLAKIKTEAGLIDRELPGIEAKLRSLEERERDEAERMTEAEREVCGVGELLCIWCFTPYKADVLCRCREGGN